MQECNRYLPGLRAWVGYRTAVVYYDRLDRAAGKGKLSFLSRIKYAMDAITSFSYKPLRLSFVLAALAVFAAIVLAVSSIFSSQSTTVMGLNMMAAVFLMGGFLLTCVGIIGEYVGRVYDEVRRRPLSLINEVYRAEEVYSHPNLHVQVGSRNGSGAEDKITSAA